ncbi:MAG TPA: glycosyltransferase family 4 protein [Acetobacteraceae bacterium]|nr:glycosyltransferase family 4 protein [Acetobacteraceae bacterium]
MTTRVLVWHWGRFGAGPRIAALLAEGCDALDDVRSVLSLSSAAEILGDASAPRCDLPVETYAGIGGLAWRLVQAPLMVMQLGRRLRRLAPDAAVCAMPSPLDLLMVAALRRLRVPVAVIVHDAEPHPGDRTPLMHSLQRALLRRVDLVVALSSHVASTLRANGSVPGGTRMLVSGLPSLAYGPATSPADHDGPRRVLCFGRLRAYKGLDLLADALRRLGSRPDLLVRVVGQGQESAALDALRALPGVAVENRWVPESEIAALLDWADALVLPYREASQSGIAPTALAAGRQVIATRVGGLVEQLEGNALATLCDPDAGSLAHALLSILQAPRVAAPPDDRREAWRDFAAGVVAALKPLAIPGEVARCESPISATPIMRRPGRPGS